jgi:hypothetical protein
LATTIKIDPLYVTLIIVILITLLTLKKQVSGIGWYLWITIAPMIIFVFFHGGQTEPEGNWIRYLAPFLFMTYPLIAASILSIIRQFIRSPQFQKIVLMIIISCLVFIQVHTAFNFTNDPAAEGLQLGIELKKLRQNNPLSTGKPVIIELQYWQYLATEVGMNDITTVLYDRPLDLEFRKSKSLIISNPELFQDCIKDYDVAYIAVQSPDLKAVIEKKFSFPVISNVNNFSIYNVIKDHPSQKSATLDPCLHVLGQVY